MCYNGCQYERFNPVTGNCVCKLPRGVMAPCEADEPIMCPHCEEEFEDEGQDKCPECNATILR